MFLYEIVEAMTSVPVLEPISKSVLAPYDSEPEVRVVVVGRVTEDVPVRVRELWLSGGLCDDAWEPDAVVGSFTTLEVSELSD